MVVLQVTELYSSSSWQHINEHLHEVLGRQCAELADTPGAGCSASEWMWLLCAPAVHALCRAVSFCANRLRFGL